MILFDLAVELVRVYGGWGGVSYCCLVLWLSLALRTLHLHAGAPNVILDLFLDTRMSEETIKGKKLKGKS